MLVGERPSRVPKSKGPWGTPARDTPILLKDSVSAPVSQHLRCLPIRQAVANDRGSQKTVTAVPSDAVNSPESASVLNTPSTKSPHWYSAAEWSP